jgi:hypothetical protein
MTCPQFQENLKLFFPEMTDIPHQDTLRRFLEQIDYGEIVEAQVELLKWLISKKTFRKYLINKTFVLAVDGTQKLTSQQLWDTTWQTRSRDGKVIQRYVYVVEATFVFPNGMRVPVMSEFLTPEEVEILDGASDEKVKRDCEQMATRRLLTRLKQYFPRLRIMVTLDGLYANGPMIEFLRKKHWDYMIVLKDDSLKEVWEDYEGLQKIEKDHVFVRTWNNRRQCYHWSNNIEYDYRTDQGKRSLKLHLVVCEESWEEIDETGDQITRSSRFAWLSKHPLTPSTVADRCQFGGRLRWGIETEFLVEKHRGYHYEHAYAFTTQAMGGYHSFLRIGLLLNILVSFSIEIVMKLRELGQGGFIKFVKSTLAGPWFSGFEEYVAERMVKPYRLSLV